MMGYLFSSETATRTTYTFRLTPPILAKDITAAMSTIQRRCDIDDPVSIVPDGEDLVISVTTAETDD